MADIAFLLLIFFLVTTTIASDKGIAVMLPPKPEDEIIDVKIAARNIFNILVNSKNDLLIEDEPGDIEDIKDMVKEFVNNRGKDDDMSVSPQKAVVSVKTDRGTNYQVYISVLDQLKQAYGELRAEHLGISLERYNALDKDIPEEKEMYKRARKEYPYQVSDAEPTNNVGK